MAKDSDQRVSDLLSRLGGLQEMSIQELLASPKCAERSKEYARRFKASAAAYSDMGAGALMEEIDKTLRKVAGGRHSLPNGDEIADLATDIAMRALSYMGRKALTRALLFCIVRTVFIDAMKKRGQSLLFSQMEDDRLMMLADPHVDSAVDQAWLDRLLNQHLSSAERDIVVLCILESRTDAEAAAILGVKEDAFKKRRQRLFGKLKDLAEQGLLPISDSSLPVGGRQGFETGLRRPSNRNRLLATILFEDIADSTETALSMGDRRWLSVLARHQADISDVLAQHQGKLVKTTGDGVLAIFDGPAKAVHAAHAIREAGLRVGLRTKSGLHTGEIELTGNDIAGISVHIAARTVQCTPKNEVWATRTVKDTCAGAGIGFEHMGSHAFKGLPDAWELYRTVA